MPRISSFYGIATYMYWDEAHDGIAGSLPRRALVLVREWAALRNDQLAANWERARRAQSLEPIDPLA
jgi:hypothetical protein